MLYEFDAFDQILRWSSDEVSNTKWIRFSMVSWFVIICNRTEIERNRTKYKHPLKTLTTIILFMMQLAVPWNYKLHCHCLACKVLYLCVIFQTSDLFISLLESLGTDAEPDQHCVSFADNTYSILDVSYLLYNMWMPASVQTWVDWYPADGVVTSYAH